MMRRMGFLGLGALFFMALLIAPAAVMAVEFQAPGTNTTINVGGYVKLDVIYNDVSSGNDSQANIEYVPGAVPLDGTTDGEEDELVMNARESRLWIKTSTPTDMGPLTTHLEFDFDTEDSSQVVSNSRHGRLRHAYGTINNWLFGTTWSLFMHLDSLPEINDFGGPTGSMFARQPQVRYTIKLTENSNLAIGIENPESYYYSGGAAVTDDGTMPDIIARYSINPGWGNLSGALMIRQIVVDEGTVDDSTLVYGAQVGGVVKFGSNDKLYTAISYGALGRYSSLATHYDAVVQSDGTLEGLQQLAGFVGFEHIWGGAMNFRSNLVIGYSQADDPDEINSSGETETTQSIHANILFNPAPSFRVGLEYLRGTRETYDGDDGELNRIQLSTMFVF